MRLRLRLLMRRGLRVFVRGRKRLLDRHCATRVGKSRVVCEFLAAKMLINSIVKSESFRIFKRIS